MIHFNFTRLSGVYTKTLYFLLNSFFQRVVKRQPCPGSATVLPYAPGLQTETLPHTFSFFAGPRAPFGGNFWSSARSCPVSTLTLSRPCGERP